MALCIRNARAEKLAREVAGTCNETLTEAIIHALEDRLERLKGKREVTSTLDEVLAISRRCSAIADIDTRTPDQILGYDESGVFDGN